MKFTGVGANGKKLGILGGLVLLLGYFFYSNVIAPGDDGPPSRVRPAAGASTSGAFGTAATETGHRTPLRPGAKSSRPEFKMGDRDKRPDPTTIDPTLRLDLLAKVQSVNLEGGERNLFQFGTAPMPKAPEPKIIPKAPPAALAQNAPGGEPQKPPPPPIPLKFYG
jgi:hypothetical protein